MSYGRSEYISIGDGVSILVWAVYEGKEQEGYIGKTPYAWFKNHSDAAAFVYGFRESKPLESEGENNGNP